jgi:hypothetical protein
MSDKKLRESTMYYAFKEPKVLLHEAYNNLTRRYIIPVNKAGRIHSLNTPIVDQIKNATYQLTLGDSDTIGAA